MRKRINFKLGPVLTMLAERPGERRTAWEMQAAMRELAEESSLWARPAAPLSSAIMTEMARQRSISRNEALRRIDQGQRVYGAFAATDEVLLYSTAADAREAASFARGEKRGIIFDYESGKGI